MDNVNAFYKILLDYPINNIKQKSHNHLKLSKLRLKKIISDHIGFVYSLCILKDGRLASCSDDKTIKIFDLKSFKCELTLKGHSLGVEFITELDNGCLVSCSYDETIKIWEIKKSDYRCIRTLIGHTGPVLKIICLANLNLCSCSCDKTIKIWDHNSSYDCSHTLHGHVENIGSIIELKNNEFIVSGGWDNTVRFWSNQNYACVKIITNVDCCSRNSIIELNNYKLIVGGNNKLSLINTATLQIETKIIYKNIGCSRCFIFFEDSCLIFGCNKRLVNVDINNCKILKVKKKVHLGNINCLLVNKKVFITCSQDKFIKIWEF